MMNTVNKTITKHVLNALKRLKQTHIHSCRLTTSNKTTHGIQHHNWRKNLTNEIYL